MSHHDDTSHQQDTSAGTSRGTSGTSSPAAGAHQEPAPATHRIITSAEPALVDLIHQDDELVGDDGYEETGWRDRFLDAVSGLRFVSESPGSLRDQIEYAEDGAYTIREDGIWRNANIWFARLIATPGLALCYFLAWALFTRLSRTLTAVPVILLALWMLNSLPVTGWLIPDGLDFTTWFPGPDPSLIPGQGE